MSFDVTQSRVLIASSLERPHIGERLVALVLRDACDKIDSLGTRIEDLEKQRDYMQTSYDERCLLSAQYMIEREEARAREKILREAVEWYVANCSGPGLEKKWMRTPTSEVALSALERTKT